MTGHTCHAHGCETLVPPRMFMCRRHWMRVSKPMRDAIWREYRPGQENDKNPSLRYLAVQQAAIAYVVFRPYDKEAALEAVPYLTRSLFYRRAAVKAGAGDPLPWMPMPVEVR